LRRLREHERGERADAVLLTRQIARARRVEHHLEALAVGGLEPCAGAAGARRKEASERTPSGCPARSRARGASSTTSRRSPSEPSSCARPRPHREHTRTRLSSSRPTPSVETPAPL